MKVATALAMVTLLAAGQAVAADMWSQTSKSQDQWSQPTTTRPPGGSYQGYTNSRDMGQQQAATPTNPVTGQKHPGTLRKFNSNSGYGPEVQFEVDRREAAQARMGK